MKDGNKKRASYPTSICDPNLNFRKLVDKLKPAEITMNLEETENLKSRYVRNIKKNTSFTINIQESNKDLANKITQILKLYEKEYMF